MYDAFLFLKLYFEKFCINFFLGLGCYGALWTREEPQWLKCRLTFSTVPTYIRWLPHFMTMELTAACHSIPLSDGNRMPLIGLGTYSDPRKVWRLFFESRDYIVIISTVKIWHVLSLSLSWKTPKGAAYESVKLALEAGYRHIDGALVYFNEHEVGQAIREKTASGSIKREDIFYCGKVCNFCL